MNLFTDLTCINAEVNKLPYEFHVSELWQMPSDHAACSNYAVAKFRALIALGWPKESLRLACCYVPNYPDGENYHAILLVDYEGQTWVMDNRKAYPTEYQLCEYKWDKLWNWQLNDWESAV